VPFFSFDSRVILNNDHGAPQVMVSLAYYAPTDPVSTKIIIMVEVNERTYVGSTINSDEDTKKCQVHDYAMKSHRT